jgi:hypothetical protein
MNLPDLLNFKPWYFDDIKLYNWNTIFGIAKIENNKLQIIAIENTEMGNGMFLKFIEMIEQECRNTGIGFGVYEFFNPRLRQWFARRGYAYNVMEDSMSFVLQ